MFESNVADKRNEARRCSICHKIKRRRERVFMEITGFRVIRNNKKKKNGGDGNDNFYKFESIRNVCR